MPDLAYRVAPSLAPRGRQNSRLTAVEQGPCRIAIDNLLDMLLFSCSWHGWRQEKHVHLSYGQTGSASACPATATAGVKPRWRAAVFGCHIDAV